MAHYTVGSLLLRGAPACSITRRMLLGAFHRGDMIVPAARIHAHGCCCMMQANVQRLKAYRSNVVIFPRNVKKPKVRMAVHEMQAMVVCLLGRQPGRWSQHWLL